MKKPNKLVAFIKDLIKVIDQDKPNQLAAALAYYSLFSLVPVVYIVLTIGGLILERTVTDTQLYSSLGELLGTEVIEFLQTSLESLSQSTKSSSTIISIISFLGILYAATGIFAQLKFALNSIWKVPPAKYAGLRGFVMARLVAFLIVIGIIVFLIATTIISSIASFIESFLNLDISLNILSTLGIIALQVAGFGLLYKYLPDTKISWRDVWPGALMVALILNIGRLLIGLFLGGFNFGSAIQAAGAVAVLLIAVNYAAIIFLIGVEITKVYAHMFGSRRGQNLPTTG